MADESDRETITDPEDLPPPAVIPIGGISKESRKLLGRDDDDEDDEDDDASE